MSNRDVLDTSFISSLLIINDVNHQKAVKQYERLQTKVSFHTPATVILELITGISRWGSIYMKRVKKFLEEINIEIIDVDKEFIFKYETYLKKEKKLKLTTIDLSILVTSKIKRAKVLTFDKKLSCYI
jgi:predicted nucleic acid-binding protein